MINSNLLMREDSASGPDKSMPSASIVVPVWNGESTIPNCLTSLLKQDIGLPEIIVIDDGSTDKTLEFVKDLAQRNPNIRILRHSTNQGLGKTLNEGFKVAKGQFVLIIHADCEIITPNYLRTATAMLLTHSDVAAVTGRRIYQIDRLTDNEKLYMVANGHLAELQPEDAEIQDVSFTEHKCDLFRKCMVESVGGFFDPRFRRSGEDQVLSSELRNRGFRLIRLGSITYRLGFGTRESTIKGIFQRLLLYGRTQAGVLITKRSSSLQGISKNKSLSKRAANRLQMTMSTLVIALGFGLTVISPYFVSLPVSAVTFRVVQYASGLNRLGAPARLALLGPVLDIVYSLGFIDGIVKSGMGRQL
jgi:glycosyltransferase involved in cell wall biosynthesis